MHVVLRFRIGSGFREGLEIWRELRFGDYQLFLSRSALRPYLPRALRFSLFTKPPFFTVNQHLPSFPHRFPHHPNRKAPITQPIGSHSQQHRQGGAFFCMSSSRPSRISAAVTRRVPCSIQTLSVPPSLSRSPNLNKVRYLSTISHESCLPIPSTQSYPLQTRTTLHAAKSRCRVVPYKNFFQIRPSGAVVLMNPWRALKAGTGDPMTGFTNTLIRC